MFRKAKSDAELQRQVEMLSERRSEEQLSELLSQWDDTEYFSQPDSDDDDLAYSDTFERDSAASLI